MRLRVSLLTALLAVVPPVGGLADPGGGAVPASLEGAVSARIDATYAVILFSDGKRSMVPLTTLSAADREWLAKFAAEHPLGHGNSTVTIEAAVHPVKKTIDRSTVEGPLETVQLCPPAVFRDQLGNTCQLYAIVHTMDIAGYYVELPEVYKIVNMIEATSPKNPWADPRYAPALFLFPRKYAPRSAFHYPDGIRDPFDWARAELRKGHPILAAFPESIWEGLPPQFVAAHEWDGGKEGHAIVVNGFTWNKATGQGTFHIVNSWRDLAEFDLTVEAAKGLLVMQWSLSAKNEAEPVAIKEVVTKVFLVRSAGNVNLYDVETNLGSHNVAAPNEAEARRLVESPAERQ
jgi:hypothetical protein